MKDALETFTSFVDWLSPFRDTAKPVLPGKTIWRLSSVILFVLTTPLLVLLAERLTNTLYLSQLQRRLEMIERMDKLGQSSLYKDQQAQLTVAYSQTLKSLTDMDITQLPTPIDALQSISALTASSEFRFIVGGVLGLLIFIALLNSRLKTMLMITLVGLFGWVALSIPNSSGVFSTGDMLKFVAGASLGIGFFLFAIFAKRDRQRSQLARASLAVAFVFGCISYVTPINLADTTAGGQAISIFGVIAYFFAAAVLQFIVLAVIAQIAPRSSSTQGHQNV